MHEVRSPTSSSDDIYLHLSAALDRFTGALPLHADLYPKLLRGYALEALGSPRASVGAQEAEVLAFLWRVARAARTPLAPIGAAR